MQSVFISSSLFSFGGEAYAELAGILVYFWEERCQELGRVRRRYREFCYARIRKRID